MFDEYLIIQPFPQLDRGLTRPVDVDLASFAGRPVQTRSLFALISQGWQVGDGAGSLMK